MEERTMKKFMAWYFKMTVLFNVPYCILAVLIGRMIRNGKIKNETIVDALEYWNDCTVLGWNIIKDGVKGVFTR